MWVAAAAPVASRGALPTVLLALPAAGRGLVAGLAAAPEPVAGLVVSYACSVAEQVRLSWCVGHRCVSFMAGLQNYSMNYKFQLALSMLAIKSKTHCSGCDSAVACP